MANIMDILNKPEFNSLNPEMKRAFATLSTEIKGKNSMEAMNIIMNFSKTIPKGTSISKQEQKLMINAFLETVSEKERQQYTMILKMFSL